MLQKHLKNGILVALVSDSASIIAAFKEIGEAFEEGKDLDVAEAIQLIQAIHNKIKDIEAA
jgi:hypothetical protein